MFVDINKQNNPILLLPLFGAFKQAPIVLHHPVIPTPISVEILMGPSNALLLPLFKHKATKPSNDDTVTLPTTPNAPTLLALTLTSPVL